MTLLPSYSSAIQNYSLCLSLGFFLCFLIAIVNQKTAAAADAYTRVNRIHFRIGMLYALTLSGLALYLRQLNADFAVSLLVGLYIYFSLHYVVIFPLIGLCKKSVSIAILEAMNHLQVHGAPSTEVTLTERLANQQTSITDIRTNRLDQMKDLKFARQQADDYTITWFGRFAHRLGEFILRLWKQSRL